METATTPQPTDEFISDRDLLTVERIRSRLALAKVSADKAKSDLERTTLEAEIAENQYKAAINQLMTRYNLNNSDQVAEDGKIIRNANASTQRAPPAP